MQKSLGMNAIADNFTARDLRNYEAKKRGFISFEAADSLEKRKYKNNSPLKKVAQKTTSF